LGPDLADESNSGDSPYIVERGEDMIGGKHSKFNSALTKKLQEKRR
jgi:hypothetical protein